MKKRNKIGLGMNAMEVLVEMSEGNPGAATVLGQMMSDGPFGLMSVLHLDDMNIRGSQIWVGFKDYCGQKMDKFLECLKSRDPGMVEKINEQCASEGHIAVQSGASFRT
jgi:hypothetical protein